MMMFRNAVSFVKRKPVTCIALLVAIFVATSLIKIDSAIVSFKKDSIIAAADTYDPESTLDITRVESRNGEHLERNLWQNVSLYREWHINSEVSKDELRDSFSKVTQIGGRVVEFSKGEGENEYNATLRLNIDSYNTLMRVKTYGDKFELRVTTE